MDDISASREISYARPSTQVSATDPLTLRFVQVVGLVAIALAVTQLVATNSGFGPRAAGFSLWDVVRVIRVVVIIFAVAAATAFGLRRLGAVWVKRIWAVGFIVVLLSALFVTPWRSATGVALYWALQVSAFDAWMLTLPFLYQMPRIVWRRRLVSLAICAMAGRCLAGGLSLWNTVGVIPAWTSPFVVFDEQAATDGLAAVLLYRFPGWQLAVIVLLGIVAVTNLRSLRLTAATAAVAQCVMMPAASVLDTVIGSEAFTLRDHATILLSAGTDLRETLVFASPVWLLLWESARRSVEDVTDMWPPSMPIPAESIGVSEGISR